MKIIVLHDKYNNNPIIIRVDTIAAIMKTSNPDEEWTSVFLSQTVFDVQERIDVVMSRIKNAEKKKK